MVGRLRQGAEGRAVGSNLAAARPPLGRRQEGALPETDGRRFGGGLIGEMALPSSGSASP